MSRSSSRKVNIELLRIVSMLGITAMHYMYWNDVIMVTTNDVTALRVTGSLIESLCIPSVACYVLISGYCDRSSEFRPKRLLRILAQVWFWSVVLHLACAAAGIVPLAASVWDLAMYVLPIMMGHYWFASAFVVMELFAPLLNAAAEHVSRKTLKYVIAALLLYESVIKTVLPFRLNQDEMGYDFGFFLMMFLIGVWLRKYGAPRILQAKETVIPAGGSRKERRSYIELSGASHEENTPASGESGHAGPVHGRRVEINVMMAEEDKEFPRRHVSMKRAMAGYLLSCAVIAIVQIGASLLHARTGSFSWLMSAPFHYNYLFAVSASVCLFLAFTQIEVPEGPAASWIRRLAPLTFGVYLIQCHNDLLPYWPEWFASLAGKSVGTSGPVGFFLWMLVSVALVYAVCSILEALRKALFDAVAGRLNM